MLVEAGFGDIVIKIRDKSVVSVKSILMRSNSTLKKLINDYGFKGELVLNEEISEAVFLEVEKYYSGGIISINNDNVCKLLIFSLYYFDDKIIRLCVEYIKNNPHDDVILGLIYIFNKLPISVKELEEIVEFTFEKNGYKYLYNNEYLKVLELPNLNFLLSSDNVLIRSEMWLLDRLCQWFIYKIQFNRNNIDFINDFKNLIESSFNREMIMEDKLRNHSKKVIKKLNITLRNNIQTKYLDLYKIEDRKYQDFIINNYDKNYLIDFNDEDKIILNDLNGEDLNYLIFFLLDMNNLQLIEIALMIIIYKKLKIEYTDKKNILTRLDYECKKAHNNRTCICICPFVNDNLDLSTIERVYINGVILETTNINTSKPQCLNNNANNNVTTRRLNCRFITFSKNEGIAISNTGKKITSISKKSGHSFLYLKLEKGIYHIKFKFNQIQPEFDCMFLGLSTNFTYSGKRIYLQPTTCNYFAKYGKSQDITHICHIGRVVNSNPNFINHGDGSIYEIIVDMNKREFWISHNDSSPVLLVKNLPSPLYPYAGLKCCSSSIELLSVFHQN